MEHCGWCGGECPAKKERLNSGAIVNGQLYTDGLPTSENYLLGTYLLPVYA